MHGNQKATIQHARIPGAAPTMLSNSRACVTLLHRRTFIVRTRIVLAGADFHSRFDGLVVTEDRQLNRVGSQTVVSIVAVRFRAFRCHFLAAHAENVGENLQSALPGSFGARHGGALRRSLLFSSRYLGRQTRAGDLFNPDINAHADGNFDGETASSVQLAAWSQI